MKENLIKLKDLKFEDFKNIINTGLKYHFDHDLENATDEEIKAVLGGHGFQGELKDTCNMLLDIIKNNKNEDYIGLGNAGFQMNKCGFLFDSALEETYLRYLSLFKYIKNGGKIKGIDSSAMHQVISARSFAGVDYLEGTKENTNQLYQALKLKYRTNEVLKNIKISELAENLEKRLPGKSIDILYSIFKYADKLKDSEVFLMHILKRISLLSMHDTLESPSNGDFVKQLKSFCK